MEFQVTTDLALIQPQKIESNVGEVKVWLQSALTKYKTAVVSEDAISSAKAKKAEDNFAAKMLSELGCNNIADKAEVLLDGLSAEAMLTENPEYIFISLMGDSEAGKEYMTGLLKKEEFASLSAVKNGNVYFLPKELFQYKPCSRWAESYRYLSDILYSE